MTAHGLAPLERIAARIDVVQVVDGLAACHLFTGSTDAAGYGMIRVDGRTWRTHRYVWHTVHGPLEAGQIVDHRCGQPCCVNIDHLTATTRAAAAAARATPRATHCRYGHEYTPANTKISASGRRQCRTCRRANRRARRALTREASR